MVNPIPKVVILCGGAGTRMREETEFKPKPMVTIGGKPILVHIMEIYASYGFTEFILCLGYKSEMIKEYFLNYPWMVNDFTISLNSEKEGMEGMIKHTHQNHKFTITFVDTGEETLTGGRVKLIEKYIDGEDFMLTYGDGVSDVNIKELWEFHKKHNKIGTITGVHPWSKYGTVNIDSDGIVTKFREKPILKDWINGGFFVFKKELFSLILTDCMLEKEPFEKLAKDRQIALYKHEGFWHCMDTYKDFQDLNKIWNNGKAPWIKEN